GVRVLRKEANLAGGLESLGTDLGGSQAVASREVHPADEEIEGQARLALDRQADGSEDAPVLPACREDRDPPIRHATPAVMVRPRRGPRSVSRPPRPVEFAARSGDPGLTAACPLPAAGRRDRP